MKNKLLFAALQCTLFCGLSFSFVSPLAAQDTQVERWVPLPSDQMAQLSKDSAHIREMMPKASFDDILRFKNSLESDWKPKNKKVYLELLLGLGSKAGSGWSNLSREKEEELLKRFNAFYLQEFDSMTASQKVLAAMYFSTGREAKLPYSEPVSQKLDLFLKAEMALEEQKTTAENLPVPESIDLSKYDWSGEPTFHFSARRSLKSIRDPELRQVYQSVLDRE